ncbi:MAG: VWA domain-containing protein [Planctomycetota bacterium]
MTLLAPLSAAAAAAIAGPLLLLLYVLKLRRKRLRVSSTMLWERAVDDLQVNEPFRWLRPSWLLLIQALALVCLALALGRPAIAGGGLSGDRVLLVIDRSASMRAADSPSAGSRLDEAKERAIELIDGLSRDTAVQVASFASEAETLTGMTRDRGEARRAIAGIEPTDEPGDTAAALQLITALTADTSETGAGTGRVVLVSDGALSQQGGATDASAPPGLILLRVGPEAGIPLDNIGIVAINSRRDFSDPARLDVFLRLQSVREQATAVQLVVRLDDAVVDRLALTVPAAAGDTPGDQTATVSLAPGEARRLRVTIEREDALASDNDAWVVLPGVERPSVLLATADDRVSWVVEDVVTALGAERVQRVTAAGLRELLAEPERLEGFGVAVLDRVGDPGSVPIPTVSFGVPLPGHAIEVSADLGADRFIAWRRAHPAMRDLSLDGVSVASPAWFGGDAADAAVLARGRSGPIVLETTDGRTRRIGVSFEPAQSTWPVEISFPLFVAQAFETLAYAPDASRSSIRTGEAPALRVPAGVAPTLTGAAQIEGRRLDGSGGGVGGVGGRAVFAKASLVGEYTLGGDAALGVNLLDGGESSIAVQDMVDVGGARIAAGEGLDGRQEIWSWFVIAAVALLTIDWLAFTLRARV